MNAREHMGQVLEGTGLYDLTGSTPVDWELDAFEAGFAPLEAAFARLLGDLFVATASRKQVAPVGELVPSPAGGCPFRGLPGNGFTAVCCPPGQLYPRCGGSAAARSGRAGGAFGK